jgi:HEAT repeats
MGISNILDRRILSSSVLIAAVLLPATGHVAPVPVFDIAALVGRADVVVVGRVSQVADAGPGRINGAEARTMIGDIDVDHVIKGAIEGSSLRFHFTLPDVPMGYRGVAAGSYRVLFLKASDGTYQFASPYHPSVIAQPGATLVAKAAVDQVAEAVGAVIRSSANSPMEKREAISALWGVQNTAARAALRVALSEREPALRLHAAGALIAANDVSGLPMATDALLLTGQAVPPDVLLNLRGAIARGMTDPAAIPSLARLLASKEDATRRAAAAALGRTNSPSAIAVLARALDDSDFDVRLSAARGLAELTGQRERRMSDAAFRDNEQQFIAYWKDWVAKR